MAFTRSSSILDEALASLEQLKSDVNALESTKKLQPVPADMLDLLVNFTENILKVGVIAYIHNYQKDGEQLESNT